MTVKACLKLPRFCRFVGCKIDSKCLVASTEGLVETHARRILNEKSDISGTDVVADACRIAVQVLDGSGARKRMKLWKVPDRLCPRPMFPLHITHLLPNMFVDRSLFGKARRIPLNQWQYTYREKYYQLKLELLLSVDCSTITVTLKSQELHILVMGK